MLKTYGTANSILKVHYPGVQFLYGAREVLKKKGELPVHLQITKVEWQLLQQICESGSDYEILHDVIGEVSADQTIDMRICIQIVCCSTRVEQVLGLDGLVMILAKSYRQVTMHKQIMTSVLGWVENCADHCWHDQVNSVEIV